MNVFENRQTGPGGNYLTASCAAIAAITLAKINDANAFVKEVRRVEGLPDHPMSGLPATARSGKNRVPSQVPGAVSPAMRAPQREPTRSPPQRARRASAA
jgi:hypothetical protein